MSEEERFAPPKPGQVFEAPRLVDTLYEKFDQSPLQYVPDAQGLPVPPTSKIRGAEPLSHESLVCLEDRRAFVVRCATTGAVLAQFEPHEVEQVPSGAYRTPARVAVGRLLAARSLGARALLGAVAEAARGGGWVAVQPIRPRCRHFARQMATVEEMGYDRPGQPEQPEAVAIYRACMRRSADGVPMDLMDATMYACDLREPRDLASEARLDARDERIIAQGQERRRRDAESGRFSVEEALEQDVHGAMPHAPVTGGGIFDER